MMTEESHMQPFPKSFPKIRIFGDNNYGSGANNALRGLLQALKHLGLTAEDIYVVATSNGIGMYQEMGEHDWLHDYIYRDILDDQINLVCTHPSHLAGKHTTLNSRVNIAYCPWETSKLPEKFVTELNKYDQVWAPTGFVKVLFVDSGVTAPVHVVPHALQEELINEPPKKLPATPSPLGYYFIGSHNPRKNPEGLVRAWLKTIDFGWSIATPVQLSMHLVPAARDENFVMGHSWMAQEMVKQFIESLGKKKQAVPRFGLMTAPRMYKDVLTLHRQNHIFVSPSRGEGFSLAAAEAAAMGNMLIGTAPAMPCMKDIILLEEERAAPRRLHGWKELDRVSTSICPMPEVEGYELNQNWWEPCELAEAIHDVREHFVQHAEDLQQTAQIVRDHLSPKAVAEQFLRARLEEAAETVARSGW